MSKCPNKEVCGSCSWSHIPYPKQLTQKLSDINGSFKLKELQIECSEILPSNKINNYRNRMDFVINFQGLVGLREKGKWWKVIDNHPCFISDEKIENLFTIVRNWTKDANLSFFDRKKHFGFLRYAVIRASSSGESLINIVTSKAESEKEEQKAKLELENLASKVNETSLVWSINPTTGDVSRGEETISISGKGYLEESINSFHYKISPQAFFQNNSYTSGLLLDTAKEFLSEKMSGKLLDLYCGSGFFSIALANHFEETLGIEIEADAIEDAKINAKNNNLNIEYRASKAEESAWQEYKPDVVILDPPRAGLHKNTLKEVIEHKPKTVLYVSCNYKNFAREMVELQEHYTVSNMRAIDMFPHTPHVELMSLLVSK